MPLEPEGFDAAAYQRWFLGSQGKKVTLSRAEPEDFELYYPKSETSLHYRVPPLGIDSVGDFSVLYDTRQVGERDHFGKIPYAAHIYGDRPLEAIESLGAQSGPHVLVVHDSFGDCGLIFGSLLPCARRPSWPARFDALCRGICLAPRRRLAKGCLAPN